MIRVLAGVRPARAEAAELEGVSAATSSNAAKLVRKNVTCGAPGVAGPSQNGAAPGQEDAR